SGSRFAGSDNVAGWNRPRAMESNCLPIIQQYGAVEGHDMVRLKWFQQPGLDRRLPVHAVGAPFDLISLRLIGRVRVTVLTPKLLVAELRTIKQRRNLDMISLSLPGPKVFIEKVKLQ